MSTVHQVNKRAVNLATKKMKITERCILYLFLAPVPYKTPHQKLQELLTYDVEKAVYTVGNDCTSLLKIELDVSFNFFLKFFIKCYIKKHQNEVLTLHLKLNTMI